MKSERRSRRAIWAAIWLQAFGYLIDVVWHGFVRPGIEPTTFGDMARHLATVHLPLYIGCASVLMATAFAVIRATAESRPRLAMACAGAMLSAIGEGWHAYSHLHMDIHHAPLAGMLSVIGFLGVVFAMWGTSPRTLPGDGRVSPHIGQ